MNAFMASSSYYDSVFFWSYDEGGGPYDHVPSVPGHTNDNTDGSLGITTDISSIAVNPDSYRSLVFHRMVVIRQFIAILGQMPSLRRLIQGRIPVMLPRSKVLRRSSDSACRT
jgi:phospholipase C